MATALQLPDTPLRSGMVGVNAIGLALVLGVGRAAQTELLLSDQYALKAGGVFALVMLVAIGCIGASHPFRSFGPANQVTTVRAMIVALVSALIGEHVVPEAATAAAVASVAAASLDGVDGWLARRTGMASAFGARFDMETDALLILVLSVLTWQLGKAGPWMVLGGLLRYLFVVAGWLLPWMQRALPPSQRRQAVCVLQIAGLSIATLPGVMPPLSTWLSMALMLVLCWSFLVDTVWLWQHGD